jgi:ribosomal protein S18 acetylase RimI-like enzyme
MQIRIRLARKNDLPKYTNLLQKTYQDAYPDKKIGLVKEYFSEEIFNTLDTQKYLASNLFVNDRQKCWLAFTNSELVGSISIIEREKDYELRGFYVGTKYQGQGIGKKLWRLALDFAKEKDITCDVYEHNTKTIEIYKKWGFEIDKARGTLYRHWPEWPEGVRSKSIYLRYKIER